MRREQIKKQIKKIAKDFNLKFKQNWFKYMWIPIRHEILIEYIGDCPDSIYKKYGKTPKERIKNIDEFFNSKDFKKCLNRFGGQVSNKKNWRKEDRWIKSIKNKEIKIELLKLHHRIKKRFGETDSIALLSIPHDEKQREWQEKNCLRHEWFHILLEKNKISFQKVNKKYWVYDEGLVTFLEVFIDKKISKLEQMKNKENYPMEKKYYIYAIKFKNLFGMEKSPVNKRKIIIKLMNNLKCLN